MLIQKQKPIRNPEFDIDSEFIFLPKNKFNLQL